jgi:hypothetical protein
MKKSHIHLKSPGIRLELPVINSLVTNIKKVFIKAPLRVQVYREKSPGIPLTPEPVLTRWGPN